MITWEAEPYWQTLDHLIPPVPIVTSDTLAPVVTEYAHLPRRMGRYKGLDMLRSQLRQGAKGVIVRL